MIIYGNIQFCSSMSLLLTLKFKQGTESWLNKHVELVPKMYF